MDDITEEVYMGKCEVWGQKFRKYHFEGQERDNNSLNSSKKGQSWRNQEKRNLRTITVRDFKESGIGNEVTADYGSCFGGVLVEINWIISQKYFFFFLKEGGRETLGIEFKTLAYGLTWNQTKDLLVYGMTLKQLSHTSSQGTLSILKQSDLLCNY